MMSRRLQEVARRGSSLVLVGILVSQSLFLSNTAEAHPRSYAPKLSIEIRSKSLSSPLWNTIGRGGASTTSSIEEVDDDKEASENTEVKENDITQHPEFERLQNYRMQQQVLLQLRATILSEALAKRGLPLPTLLDVATPEGAQPPQTVDWDCALSTEDEPKSCLYSFDAEPNTKVVAPINTDQWISLSALNRLRRTDPSKVEPMWHSQYAVLKSWFDSESEYSLLQHIGINGFLLHALLQGSRLQLALGFILVLATIVCMPLLEYFINRFLVSGFFWSTWASWARFVHAALPLKLLLGQMLYKAIATLFGKLVGVVKERLVDIECQILEQHVPLTVGPGSEYVAQDEEELGETFLSMDADDDDDDANDSDEDDLDESEAE